MLCLRRQGYPGGIGPLMRGGPAEDAEILNDLVDQPFKKFDRSPTKVSTCSLSQGVR